MLGISANQEKVLLMLINQTEAHSINLKTHLKKVSREVWAISVCILINKGRGIKT